jgi:hypothetical protein
MDNTDRPVRMPTLRQLKRVESKLKRQILKMARREDALRNAKARIDLLGNALAELRLDGFRSHESAGSRANRILEQCK